MLLSGFTPMIYVVVDSCSINIWLDDFWGKPKFVEMNSMGFVEYLANATQSNEAISLKFSY